MTTLRDLPSVDQLLHHADDLLNRFGRPLTLDALRLTLDEARARIKRDGETASPSPASILASAESHLAAWTTPSLAPVINATGVVLHTNLGRAPLSESTIQAMNAVAANYSNLEFDLGTGKRGSRLIHAESVLQKLLGVESALVVNNNASAVLLVLSALANKKRVVIPRSQLVEIGGGFRVPDVMKQSGAKLVEIGTTNKVRISDYMDALDEPTALVMRAHRSNFKIVGFTEEPELAKIVDVAHKANVIVVDDLGSGALIDTVKYGLTHEPTVQESLAAGVDVVCFSGDKLLGGPQAGIIVGKKELIDRIKKHPLARAVRADKTCLAGITATLMHYLKDEAEREIPVVRMMSLTAEQVRVRAEAWRNVVGQGEVVKSESTVGGGSLPEESMLTFVLSLQVKSPDKFLAKLREANPPVIARTENDKVLLDPRTVLDDESLLRVLKDVLHDYR
ncbi:MAG TPA: L-seryl-tRNA(Sec) selenium transferase [Anaerolineales bacterium]|jgi:L-seryl-tRNA(Ser) seleniumtransferase|nr:L-seryl-tRNA(Sec) selenium transferase [Anaerolineales bacterium]HQX16267.1 L-seryl-tRNA(Sec) selenium transferase [Anaerolineales bacterium]